MLAGVGAAFAASTLYNVGIALQALEARTVTVDHTLRLSLLRRLVRRPLWVGGTALTVLGWPLQVAALLVAPLTLVQPALALGLLVLLAVAVRFLGEPVGKRELAAVLAIGSGVALLATVAPAHTAAHAGVGSLAAALAALGLAALVPYAVVRLRPVPGLALAVAAGLTFAWTGVSTKLVADAFDGRAWVAVLGWTAATTLVGALATVAEMSALQVSPATRVAPVVFAVQTVVPVLVAPVVLAEAWNPTPGVMVEMVASLTLVTAGGAALTRSAAAETPSRAEATRSPSATGASPRARSEASTAVSARSADAGDPSVTTTTSPARTES